MKIGITGHQHLPNQQTWNWVSREIQRIISVSGSSAELVGYSSLAVGADQLFAELILAVGGRLSVVLPFADYERTFESKLARDSYYTLLDKAYTVESIHSCKSDEEAFFTAGKRVVTLCDVLVAVWNGKKAQGLGGTADVVHFARDVNKEVMHLNTTLLLTKLL
jgi:hypothetical protein